MEILVKNPNKNKEVAKLIIATLNEKNTNVILLSGPMGSGKTTLTHDIVSELGFENKVSSPTFVIEKIYKKGNNAEFSCIHHIDLYRLLDSEIDINIIEDIKNTNELFIIEWPELVINNLTNYVLVKIEVIGDFRKFHVF